MITIWIEDNEGKIREMIEQILNKAGNTNVGIIKKGNVVKIIENERIKDFVSLQDKLIELEDSLELEKKGKVYKEILDKIEKPLFEHMLERTEGNQLKAARILGINRNTMRSKIKRLGIEVSKWKSQI